MVGAHAPEALLDGGADVLGREHVRRAAAPSGGGGGWFTGQPHLLARKNSSRRFEMCSPISSSDTP